MNQTLNSENDSSILYSVISEQQLGTLRVWNKILISLVTVESNIIPIISMKCNMVLYYS